MWLLNLIWELAVCKFIPALSLQYSSFECIVPKKKTISLMSSMENCNLPISSHHIVGISSLIRCYLCEHGCTHSLARSVTPLYCRRMTKCLLSGFLNANERLDYSCLHSFLLFIYIFFYLKESGKTAAFKLRYKRECVQNTSPSHAALLYKGLAAFCMSFATILLCSCPDTYLK